MITSQVTMRIAAALFAFLTLSAATPAFGQFTYTQIKSFCMADQFGSKPVSRLTQGSDGALYGTTSLGGGTIQGTAFKLNQDGSGYSVLHRFLETGGDGMAPFGELLEGSDGALYGTTCYGGSTNQGTVFKLGKDGSGYNILHVFKGAGGDGAQPLAGVIEGSDGNLYGTTHYGGATDLGTVFKMNKDGSGYSLLHSFASFPGDGVQPSSRPIEGSDGAIYGVTYFGGTTNKGAIFKLDKNGSGYRILRSFTGTGGDGARPYGGLLEGSDGALFGTTTEGGAKDLGSVFKINKDGSAYRVLYSYTNAVTEGTQPYGSLIWGSDGALYGTTAFGGSAQQGTVFRMNQDGSAYKALYQFAGGGDAAVPYAGLIQGSDGTLFGTANSGGKADRGAIFKLNKDGSAYGVLHKFSGGGDAVKPYPRLFESSDGVIYGTSWNGGSADQGTVFRMNRDGSDYRFIHDFTGTGGDGALPHAGLIEGSDGAIYGTTNGGGSKNQGTLFMMNKDGSGYRVLHDFTGLDGEGGQPFGTLLEGSNGVFYGTTAYGGSADQGIVFRMNKDGSGYSVLRSFTGRNGDGSIPFGGLIKGSDGVLYGTTAYGGNITSGMVTNSGTVFKLQVDGGGFSVLHNFTGVGGDGKYPFAPLIEGSDGALYGVTAYGGVANFGTVFKLNKNGTGYVVLRSFTGVEGDGAQPATGAALIEGADGALYGTTYYGGTANAGTIFKLNKNRGGYSVLHSFTGPGEDGANPYAGLIKGGDGALYGTTLTGGLTCGTVFRVAPSASLSASTNGDLILTGPAGFRFAIQYREDLGSAAPWQFLTNITISTGPAQFPVSPLGAKQRRFYRAELLP
jgi:uncharacterized repeat protein (TIGR03803 family)